MNGYILLDVRGLDIADDKEQTLTGLYADITTALAANKPIIATGFKDASAFPVQVTESSGDYVIYMNTLQITVEDDDGVTVESMIPAPTKTTTKSSKS